VKEKEERPGVAGASQTHADRGIALVTGASSGIGAELAVEFARQGHPVVLTARDAARLSGVAARIEKETARRSEIIVADLAAVGGVDRVVAALAERNIKPAFIVNAAGFGRYGVAGKLSAEEQLAIVNVNCGALTELTVRLLPGALEQRGGVLNVGSVGGFFPGPGMSVYFASKAFVHSFSQALRSEYLGQGLRVSALCPGPVPTGFQARAGMIAPRLPRLLGRDARSVAAAGYRGLMRNRAVVVPGFLNLIMAAAGGLMFHRAFAPFVRWYHLARRERKGRVEQFAAKPHSALKNTEAVSLRASRRSASL
jgi:short-subunit dehydrogenase